MVEISPTIFTGKTTLSVKTDPERACEEVSIKTDIQDGKIRIRSTDQSERFKVSLSIVCNGPTKGDFQLTYLKATHSPVNYMKGDVSNFQFNEQDNTINFNVGGFHSLTTWILHN